MSSVINDYGVLFDTIARRIIDHDTVKATFEQYNILYDSIKQYSSKVEEHKNSICTYWDICIPGNEVSRVILVEDNADLSNITRFYRSGGSIWFVLNINSQILYSETVKRNEVSKFFNEYKNQVSKLFSVEDYTDFVDKQILSFFAAFDLIYKVFAASKDVFIVMKEKDGLMIPIDKDNLVYENCFQLIANRTRPISEGRIIRAIQDGVKNVSNSILQARLMPEVQETSD